jgi:hypothetical protein
VRFEVPEPDLLPGGKATDTNENAHHPKPHQGWCAFPGRQAAALKGRWGRPPLPVSKLAPTQWKPTCVVPKLRDAMFCHLL